MNDRSIPNPNLESMKKVLPILVAGVCLVLAGSLRAQISSTELVTGTVTLDTPPFEQWYPNVFDPIHPKRLTFQGAAQYLGNLAPVSALLVWFDYLDLQGQVVNLAPHVFLPNDNLPFTINIQGLLPFCPERVSIHLQTNDPDGYFFQGQFTHECIPEPAQYGLLAGLGLLGLAGYRHGRPHHRKT